MSKTKSDQLTDCQRLKATWEDDPAQLQPWPLTDALKELDEQVDSGHGDEPAVRLATLE